MNGTFVPKSFLIFSLVIIGTASLAAPGQTYGGSATGINAVTTINGASTTTIVAGTGELPSIGGNISATSQHKIIPGILSAGTIFSTTSGVLNSSQSTSVVNDLAINLPGLIIRANRVTVSTNCVCCPGAEFGLCTSSVQVNGLTFTTSGGSTTNVTVTGQANQTVTLPNGLGTLVINERTTANGSISVNGLHVNAAANGNTYNIIVARAVSLLECLTAAPTPAEVTVSGRVLTSTGEAIAGATVTLTNMNGVVRTATSNSTGNYIFTEVTAGFSYALGATHKHFTFQSQVVNVDDDMTVDIVASP